MKLSVYHGNGVSTGGEFRFVGGYSVKDGVFDFSGYETQNSTERKANFEISFHEALELIETLKRAIAETPCPLCHRK